MNQTTEYKLQLAHLHTFFGGQAVVSQADVSRYTGRCNRWVKDHLRVGKEGITLPLLAKRLVEVCG